MNKNRLALTVGLLLIVLFALMLFTFQVRQTEVALVTTFGKPSRTETEPGLKWKLPWPIQRVLKFDNRVQNFEGKFEETQTRDGYNLLISVYAGWKIKEPTTFRNALPTEPPPAQPRPSRNASAAKRTPSSAAIRSPILSPPIPRR